MSFAVAWLETLDELEALAGVTLATGGGLAMDAAGGVGPDCGTGPDCDAAGPDCGAGLKFSTTKNDTIPTIKTAATPAIRPPWDFCPEVCLGVHPRVRSSARASFVTSSSK